MVKRRFRLTRSTDFMRVRRSGKSYAHPLIVLMALPNEDNRTRCAVSASRSLGKAIQRNRAKRLLRECLRSLYPMIEPGWDILIIARRPLVMATFQEADQALKTLLARAHLIDGIDNA